MNKSVLKNLSKFESNVELAEMKVDLATLQSIIKLDDTALKNKDKAMAAVKKANDALVNANNIVNVAIRSFQSVIDEGTALEKQAKDLGLSLPNEARVALASATREINQFQDLKNKLSVKF
jgi:uncharacterized tellurite resistance protein B-like protein